MRNEFSDKLLPWFSENARKLPWRETSDPYHVCLSEIMLQQTRVVAVVGYYQRFLEKLPTISDLASCPEEELMKLWQGLGYYNRARNLQKLAQQVMERHGGEFPHTYSEIHELSGIGDYTAGAIASTVYGLPYPAVDGNVFRVMSRITGDYGDISTLEMKKRVSHWVLERMPPNQARNFNQGLMELGATVCLPNGSPLCETCPVSGLCFCFGTEKWRELPVKPTKKPRKIENRWVYYLTCGEKIALRCRPKKGLLAGLWEYPHCLHEENAFSQLHSLGESFGQGKHIFTHIEWRMEGFLCEVGEESLPEGCIWVTKAEIRDKYSLPSAFRWVGETLEKKEKAVLK